MDINQSSLSRYKASKPGISRSVSDVKTTQDTEKSKDASSSQQSLKQLGLKQGQLVKGQIIDRRYNDISIQLEPDHQLVTAKLALDVPLSIGQEASFQVTENASDHFVLKYIPDEVSQKADATIQKILTASNLAMTAANKAIVSELLNHRMPVDTQTLQTLIKASYLNREAAPLSLVLMYKNNIPLTKENIRQFTAYQNGTNAIINDINTITKNLSELIQNPKALFDNVLSQSRVMKDSSILQADSPLTQDPLDQVINMNGKLINILNNEAVATPEELQGKALTHLLNTDELANLGKVVQQLVTDGSLLLNKESSALVAQISDGSLLLKDATSVLTNLSSQADPSVASVITQFTKQLASLQNSPVAIAEVLTPTDRVALLEYIQTMPISNDLKNQMEDGTVSAQKLLNFIQENLSTTTKEAAPKLLQSPEYIKLLEGALQKKWTLTPERIAKKALVSALYQNLQEDIEHLNQLTNENLKISEELQIREPIKNLQENIKFMTDLNQTYTYLQLPIQLKEQQLHSDLYVFTNKKALKESADCVSVLLHLDMNHLGALNIHVQMSKNQIQAKFFLENKEAEQLVSNNIPLLEDALQKKGYQLHAEVDVNYVRPNFCNDFIEQNSSANVPSCYTFDIRT